MKTILIVFISLHLVIPKDDTIVLKPSDLYGAWETSITMDGKQAKLVKIITPRYFISSIYSESEYLGAMGGTWTLDGSVFTETFELCISK